MKRTTTITPQPVFEGYGFEARGMEYVVIDGRWRVFSAGKAHQYNLTVAEVDWLANIFVIKSEVPA